MARGWGARRGRGGGAGGKDMRQGTGRGLSWRLAVVWGHGRHHHHRFYRHAKTSTVFSNTDSRGGTASSENKTKTQQLPDTTLLLSVALHIEATPATSHHQNTPPCCILPARARSVAKACSNSESCLHSGRMCGYHSCLCESRKKASPRDRQKERRLHAPLLPTHSR